ncbi:hypothetical protein RB195_014133 [Necator americanus]|uniref:Endonuclease/exonuclease/phosphatase domain-containing protein n=1 Tax=Necator americanus TaxID=51031 RepID=A0ABR1DYT3_NECAM
MKPDKRKREYELRQEARERNKDSELVVNLPYNVYRSDRSMKRGSGVCAIAKAFISAQIVTPNYDLKADLLSADIFCSNNMSQLRFILVYRPPNSSAVDDKKLVEVLSDLAVVNNHAIILGDFNLHVDWVNSIAFNSASSLYLDFFSNAELVQNVNLPTHSDRILDIILTPSICTLDVKLLPPLASSDHAIIQFDSPAIMSAPGIPMPNFLNADYSSLNNYFSGVDWLTLFDQYSSCSDIYFRFCKKVYEGLAKFVPFRFPRSFSLILPCQLKSLYTQKLRRFEELDDPLRSSLYKKLCSDIDFHMRRYLAYRERQLSRRESKKPFYLYLRHRMKANARLPSLVDQTGATYVTDADKTKAPAMHFANVFSSNCSDTIPEIVGIGPVQQQCSNMFFHPTDIYIHLKSLEPSVSETYDGIPPIVYKECAAILSPPLAHIFNISLSLGEVPQVWKNAIVTVIPKSPGASTYTNLTDSVFDWSQALNQDWMISFLNMRSMTVKAGHGYSAKFPCTSGVLQGGVLIPLLFLIYTVDLPSVLRTSPLVKVQMYADDIKIYGIHDDENYHEVRKGDVAEYSMNGVTLNTCKSVRDLGIFVDDNLNFSEHIDHVVRKAYSSLFRLFRIAHTINPTILTRLYKSFVLPHLEYGSHIWSPSKKKHIAKLEKVQDTSTRMLFRRMSANLTVTSYSDRLKKLANCMDSPRILLTNEA